MIAWNEGFLSSLIQDNIMIPSERICTKCKRLLPLSEFSKLKHGKYGLRSNCRSCDHEAWRERTEKRKRNRERGEGIITHKTCNRCGQNLSIEHFWQDKSTIDGKAKSCKNCQREYARNYYEKNREWVLKRTKENRKQNKEKVAKQAYSRNQKIRNRVLEHLCGGAPSCEVCGFSDDIRFLQIDHKQRDGNKERGKFKGASPFYFQILRMTQEEARKKYRVLCLLHNWADRYGITGEEYAIIKVKQ